MINVTLTFTSIPEVLDFFASIQSPATAVKVEAAPTPKSVKAAKPAPEPVVALPPVTVQPEAAPAPAAAPAAIDYPTLQKAVFALAGKSREAAAAVAASLGVKTFKELPESQWSAALAAVNDALAAA